MTPEATLNEFIRSVVNLILGESAYAYAAKQPGNPPRPRGAYASVDFTMDINIGTENRTLENNISDDDLTETIRGLREITMSVNFFRDLANDNARKVRTGLIRESVQDLFKASQLGLVSRSDVREISEPLENGWEERAQLDIVLSAVGTDTDIIRSILAVDISGEFQARGLIYNFSIEV